MPRMTHWNSRETINVSGAKAAVYQAQGWVTVGGKAEPVAREAVTAMTTASAEGPVEQVPETPAEPVAKKAPAKKATKRAAKKS